MENIVIVDPFSTGVNFFEDILQRGFHPVAIWSKRSDMLFEVMEEVRSPIEHRYQDVADFYVECPTYEETFKLVRGLKPKFVLPGADLGIELATHLADDLWLPANPYAKIPQLTNKFLMHQTLIDHGVRGIRGKIVHNLDEALEYYRTQGFKGCVLKPYRGASSVDVRICDSEEELKAAYEEVFAGGNYMGGEEEGMLLQECIVGTEYIVNTVSYAGRHKLSALWKHSKKKVEGGGMVYNYTETLNRPETGSTALVNYAYAVLDALGVEFGNVHSEFMIDQDGPVLIEINCRPMGSNMSAEFLDQIWGHHETDLCLDAYLHPEAFLEHVNDPFRPLAKGLKKHLITAKEQEIISSPALSLIRRQKSFCKASLGKAVGDRLARTVDLDTAAGVVYLVNKDEAQLYRDRNFLERAEELAFPMLFSDKRKEASEQPKKLATVQDVLGALKPVGSVLLLSNEIETLPGVTVVNVDSVEKVQGGYQTGVLDLVFKENEDYEEMTDAFYAMADKVREDGLLVIPERTYWHFSSGMESFEILCEAVGYLIEAPNMYTGKVFLARKR